MSEKNYDSIAKTICNKPSDISCDDCFRRKIGSICEGFSRCRISEKTNEQLDYVLSDIDNHTFLRACAGSGKTEVVGLKAAYEIKKWRVKNKGIAILSFTNDATNVIRDRVKQFSGKSKLYPHFIGTLSGFIYSYIVQPFSYKWTGYQGSKGDFSINIVDEDMETFSNHWLESFKCPIPYINSRSTNSIYAHQIGFDVIKKDFYFRIVHTTVWLKDYYRSESVQNYISKQREKRRFPNYLEERYIRESFSECKKRFWEQGFANFDDMNILAIRILRSEICDEMVNRFPVIIIDECQDLSGNELMVLEYLKNKGCCIHFIGDMNQSIYDFKMVTPENIESYVKDFKLFSLNKNFRSCKEIVDFSNRLIKNESSQSENVESKFGKQSLLYIEYNVPEEAVETYEQLLNKLNLTGSVNRVLVKQNSLKKRLERTTEDEFDRSEPLIVAIQLWKKKTPNHMGRALELAGFQISKWFGGGKTKQSYYCPKDINSIYAWRIFLMHVLNDMVNLQVLSDMNKTYGNWHRGSIEKLNLIIKDRYGIISDYDSNESREIENLVTSTNFRTSRGNTDKLISLSSEISVSNIPVMTIHASKGCTYDSILVISSTKESSDGGHWKKHWLQDDGEGKRIGYVASTRAKYLLVWGVPKLNARDRSLIESYGFISAKEVINKERED